jgi:ribosomal protein L37E
MAPPIKRCGRRTISSSEKKGVTGLSSCGFPRCAYSRIGLVHSAI